jgi:hypothetical protein
VGDQTDSARALTARAWIWQRWGVDVEREGSAAASAALREALDALVHDAADHLVAQVHNDGLSAQLTYLIAAGYLGDTADPERTLAPPDDRVLPADSSESATARRRGAECDVTLGTMAPLSASAPSSPPITAAPSGD